MKSAVIGFFMIAGVAVAADDSDNKTFLKELEGAYKVTSAEESGGAPPPGFLDAVEKVTIKGNKLSFVFKGDGGKMEEKTATITVDAASKPVHLDIKPEDGPKKDQTVLGIVSVEGDTMKICFNDGTGNKRPAEFKTAKDDKMMALTLKKIKE
jgi:uncharacterized protein (TIGR03067 family)